MYADIPSQGEGPQDSEDEESCTKGLARLNRRSMLGWREVNIKWDNGVQVNYQPLSVFVICLNGSNSNH